MRDRRVTASRERGSVLIITAVFMLVAVLFFAVVVDFGNQRSEKKQTTLATDAAALAAASTVDFTGAAAGAKKCSDVAATDTTWGNTVYDVALHYVTVNDQEAPTGINCQVVFDSSTSAYVTVSHTEDVEYAVGSGLGFAGGTVNGSSSARISKSAGGNLYPIGLCDSAFAGELGAGETSKTYDPPVPDNSAVFTNAVCSGNGNKRQIQFKPGLTGDQCGQVGMWCYDFNAKGYKGAPKLVESDTGKDWNKAASEWNRLYTSGDLIWVPVVKCNSADCNKGGGTKFQYEVTHFAQIKITNSYDKKEGFKFEVHRLVKYDVLGPPEAVLTKAHICATGQGTAACDPKPAGGTGPVTSPTPGECTVESVTPPATSVPVTAAGVSTATVDYAIVVTSTAECTGLTARAKGTVDVTADVSEVTNSEFLARFPSGRTFATTAQTYTIEVDQGGQLRHSSARLTTTGGAGAPSCLVSASPGTQTVKGTQNNGGNQANTSAAVDITVTIPQPTACGTITAVARIDSADVALIGGGTAAASMSFTLPAGTGLPKNGANNVTYTITIRNNGSGIGNTPNFTVTL